jgi:hypothetical protein
MKMRDKEEGWGTTMTTKKKRRGRRKKWKRKGKSN